MKIDIFSVCYNEKVMLPYFIKYYKQFARKIVVYDNMSDDQSIDIMKENGIEIIPFDTNNKYIESTQTHIRNNCWKNSDADWVIVCDIDELVYNSNIVEYLSDTKYTYLFPRAYEMMSENIPQTDGQIFDEIQIGYPIDEFMSYNIYPNWKSNYSKGIIFKPSEISETNFGVGSHYCNPMGNVKTNVPHIPEERSGGYPLAQDDLKLLHYKYLSRDYVKNKLKQWFKSGRIDEAQYSGWHENEIDKQYDAWLPFCKKVI